MKKRFCQWSVALATLALVPGLAAAQQGGTISGHVIDAVSQQPVPSAQVVVVGTTRGAITDVEGQYRIDNVNPGTVQVRAQRIGYASRTEQVVVTAGRPVTLDLALTQTAVQIDQIVVTATGQTQRKRESGAATGRIAVDSLNLAPVTNAANLIQARVPGVTVLPSSGTVGANAGIHIRGANSVSLSNDPLLIIDGIRANGDLSSSTIGVGGQRPSRLNDLNPEDIANIEIVKGPAAAALYGTAAANGVIYVTTKRGHSGETRWTAHAEDGVSREVTDFPANFSAIDVTSSPGDTIFGCANDFASRGLCEQDALLSFNPLEQASPYSTGNLQNYGLSVAGGGEKTTYYLSGNFEKNRGVISWNHMRRTNVRANVRGQLRDNFDVTANVGYTQSRLRLPQDDNNVLGILGGGLLGNAQDDSVGRGYGVGQTPADIANIDTRQNVERFTGSVQGNWQALQWLRFTGTAGLDFTNRIDQEVVHPDKVQFADLSLGQRTSNPFQNFLYTAQGGVSADYSLAPSLRATSSVGVEYNDDITRGTFAFGETLLPGTSSLNGTNTLFSVGETNLENVTLGAYVQEQLGWNDRLFLTGAVRGDKNSAFGQDFKSILYPSASLSWVIGEEPFFPSGKWVSSLRLRAAYGESGQRPNFRDAIRFLTPVSVTIADQDAAGFTIGGVGNQNLKAERSKEFELGFDAGLLDQRVALTMTYYNKRTTDALISRLLPPSNGQQQTRFENLGQVKNHGLELLLNATVLNSDPVQWDVTLNGSTNHNRVVDLGEGIKPIIINNGEQRHQNGYPLGGYWARPILSASDENGDGTIVRDEVTLGDSAVFMGTPFPTRELSVSSGVTFFKWFRVSGLLDYHGGQKLLNLTERFRCVSFANCRAANDLHAPIDEQVAYIAGLEGSDAGYMEDASFWKLRELSLTVSAPRRIAQRMGVSGAKLTFSGRNLATWTKYSGFDPELVETGGAGFRVNDFLTQPPVRYYTVRLDLTW